MGFLRLGLEEECSHQALVAVRGPGRLHYDSIPCTILWLKSLKAAQTPRILCFCQVRAVACKQSVCFPCRQAPREQEPIPKPSQGSPPGLAAEGGGMPRQPPQRETCSVWGCSSSADGLLSGKVPSGVCSSWEQPWDPQPHTAWRCPSKQPAPRPLPGVPRGTGAGAGQPRGDPASCPSSTAPFCGLFSWSPADQDTTAAVPGYVFPMNFVHQNQVCEHCPFSPGGQEGCFRVASWPAGTGAAIFSC